MINRALVLVVQLLYECIGCEVARYLQLKTFLGQMHARNKRAAHGKIMLCEIARGGQASSSMFILSHLDEFYPADAIA